MRSILSTLIISAVLMMVAAPKWPDMPVGKWPFPYPEQTQTCSGIILE